jgi:hypothetical protein
MRDTFDLSAHAGHVISERRIKIDWVAETLDDPIRDEIDQSHPDRRRAFRPIAANGGRILRVVYSVTAEGRTRVITAFFDRGARL